MRKLAAAILLLALIFNAFGYRLFVSYLESRSDRALEARFDQNFYNESQLLELKIPVHMPYQLSQATYERCDGEIEVGGILYKYVKRKVFNDTLYVQCLPNIQKMHLQLAKNQLFKSSNDLNGETPQKSKANLAKNIVVEYDNCMLLSYTSPFYFLASTFFNHSSAAPLSRPHLSPGQPPDQLCS